MSRRSFIQALGATCRNWTWSWSFVNHAKRIVIFGAWDKETSGATTIILDERWERSSKGRRKPAYSEALEYVQLVEQGGYQLQTFPMTYSDRLLDQAGAGPSVISGFTPELTTRRLGKIGSKWYASTASQADQLPEEISEGESFAEGSARTIKINAYERSLEARKACLRHYGAICFVCAFDFESTYGAVASGLVHVHHLVPIAEIEHEYMLDPIADLRPVCPNCHAVIHRTKPPLNIDELKAYVNRDRDA